MKPSQALAQHRDAALAIIAKYPVSNPRIFGSVARGEDTYKSDIDIIVDTQDGCSYFDLFRIEDAISELVKFKVDVHTLAEFGERSRERVQGDLTALSRTLKVVGEICGRLNAEFPQWASDKREFGLDDAYRLRNKIVHGYDTLDTKLLLAIARDYLPSLQVKLTEW